MNHAELIRRSQEITAMERAITDARRALTMAEVDLIYAARGCDRFFDAQKRFEEVIGILTKLEI